MVTDSGGPLPPPPHRDIWRIPEILDLQIRLRRFDRPRRVITHGVTHEAGEAVEFELRISEPFPIRALGPALWVGDHAITSAEQVDELTYRFHGFELDKLRADAPITLGWSVPGERRRPTRFRFTMPR